MDDKRWYSVVIVLGVVAPHEVRQSFHKAVSLHEAVGLAVLSLIDHGCASIRTLGVAEVPVDTMKPTVAISNNEMRNAIRVDILENRRITAIKKVREMTGWGLKEAKGWVDREFPQGSHSGMFGPSPRLI